MEIRFVIPDSKTAMNKYLSNLMEYFSQCPFNMS